MNIKSVAMKIGKMRKPQNFVIYPNGTSDTHIVVQSDKCIGRLDKKTGEFQLSTSGQYFIHLQDAVTVDIPGELKEEIRRKYNAASNGNNGQITILGGGGKS